MNVYKILVENNTIASIMPSNDLEHGEIGFKEDNKTIRWLALECPDKKTAFEVADLVVKMIWSKHAA